jgi:cytochrome oxidase Cu insertion factor (SCO1/SenC/PrrC family)
VVVFFAPLAVAFAVYYGSNWRPLRHTNHGMLIEPPRPLPPIALPTITAPEEVTVPAAPTRVLGAPADARWLIGKWSLVYVGDGRCLDACRKTLYFIQQTQLGLGNLIPRTQQVWLSTDHCCDPDADRPTHSEQSAPLLQFDASGEAARSWLDLFPQDHRDSTVFIVDPRGNLMMRYDSNADPKGLREDLKKLLGLSHIG